MRILLVGRASLGGRIGAASGRWSLAGRNFASTSYASTNKQELDTLLGTSISRQQSLPRFTVPASSVKLIEEPAGFYDELLSIIFRAKRQIFLASLYVGKTETDLISHILNALRKNPNLTVTILVDSLRSTREGDYDGSQRTESCASLLSRLQADFPDRVQIRLYRAPGLPGWAEKLVGKRFVEGWGLQHMKIYGGDDEVMISGANLSNDYFTNRRDRYIRMRDRKLSQYMRRLLMVASRHSYALEASDCDKYRGEGMHCPYTLTWDDGKGIIESSVTRFTGPKKWKGAMRGDVDALTMEVREQQESHLQDLKETSDTITIVPVLQMGRLGVKQEEACVPLIVQAADQTGSRLDFTTGYFSINPTYANLILQGRFRSDMVTASPQANGFYGSKGVSRHLPAAYTWLERCFWERLKQQGREGDVKVREWAKSGWTYHAKGIWLYPNIASSPTVTLLGSSNFGTRSAALDLECTLLIDATLSPSFQNRLREEVDELQRDAIDVVSEEMFRRKERQVHWGIKLATWFIKKML